MKEDCDPGLEREYHRDQRKLYSGEYLYTCPDCGQENALTQEMKNRGYHCDACTKAAEQGF